MRTAVAWYRALDRDEEIVRERFTICDEVRTCRELFEKLDDTLSASWDMMYAEAAAFYAQYGHLDAPRRYKTEAGYSLGAWLQTQRKVRAGEQFGRLDAISMRWENARDLSWARYYEAARAYHDAHGDLNVKAIYVTPDGVNLGSWITNLRTYRRVGSNSRYLLPERIAALDAIGMIWDQPDYIFERNFAALAAYHRLHGDSAVPADHITADGIRLGLWAANLRLRRRSGASTLTDEQLRRLDELGFSWVTRADAARYRAEHGNLDVRCGYVTAEGYALGKWLSRQRVSYGKGSLPAEKAAELEALGIRWNRSRANDWEVCFAHLAAFHASHGHVRLPADYTVDGIWLNK